MFQCLLSAASVLCLVLIAGCQSSGTPQIIQQEDKLPEQVFLGDAEIMSLEKKLEEKGIQIVSIGQDYLISIPSAQLFGEYSPRLTWASYEHLNEVACYLRQFRKVGLNITAYTTHYISKARSESLSRARAENVANYLWSQGIDARLVLADGKGNEKPIMRHVSAKYKDKSPNSRVEITFRRAVA